MINPYQIKDDALNMEKLKEITTQPLQLNLGN